jgi:rhodanese-related sulfurtransferase
MSNEVPTLLSRRRVLGLFPGAALAVAGFFHEDAEAATARLIEARWPALRRFANTALFIDARVENIEGRRSTLPGGIRNLIQVEYDHNQTEQEFKFVNDSQRARMIEEMGKYSRVVVLCEAGERAGALARRVVEMSRELGTASKVTNVYNLDGGLRGITDEDRVAEIRIDSTKERL